MMKQICHRAVLREVAGLARRSVLSGASDSGGLSEARKVEGTCLYASYLALLFMRRWHPAFQPTLCGGSGGAAGQGALDFHGAWRGHYWLEVSDPDHRVWIVDVTSDQFGWNPITIDLEVHLAHRYRKGCAQESLAALEEIAAAIEDEQANSAWASTAQ